MSQDVEAWDTILLERKMQVMWDSRLDVSLNRDTGKWFWHPRLYDGFVRHSPSAMGYDFTDPEVHGSFDTYWDALCDAVAPYEEPDEDDPYGKYRVDGMTEIVEGVFCCDEDTAIYIVDDSGEVVCWQYDEVCEDGSTWMATIKAVAMAAKIGTESVRANIVDKGLTMQDFIACQ